MGQIPPLQNEQLAGALTRAGGQVEGDRHAGSVAVAP